MFEVVVCRDQIAIPYHHLKFAKEDKDGNNNNNGLMTIDPQTLCDLITHRYNDRVQINIGLFVDLYDIVKVTEIKSIPDVKVAYGTVLFRYIVFNPPVGSIWEGQIISSDEEGIRIMLSFFDEIFVPYPNLPDGSEFDDTLKVWTWTSQDSEDEEAITFSFENSKMVRFRVCEVRYNETNPNKLMSIIASMDSRTAGLGLKDWWVNPPEEE